MRTGIEVPVTTDGDPGREPVQCSDVIVEITVVHQSESFEHDRAVSDRSRFRAVADTREHMLILEVKCAAASLRSKCMQGDHGPLPLRMLIHLLRHMYTQAAPLDS